jgi:sugar phosphate isomerase/epimerase
MQIGVLSKVFVRPTLEAVFDAVAAAGLRCVQFNPESAGLAPMPDEIPTELAQRIRCAAAARHIAIASVQGTFNMSHPDAEFRRQGLRRLQAIACACGQLGTSVIAICIGTRDRENMWRHHVDNDSSQAWRDMTACVRAAVDIARQAGVILALEPEVSNVVDSAEKARRLLNEIGSAHLKITMDAANLFHTGELSRMAEVLENAFALLGRDIILSHAKDLSKDGEAGQEAAGHGRLDYDRYLSLLHAYGFEGPLLLHGLAEWQVLDCTAFLLEKLARVAGRPAKPRSGSA